jgi:endonuclease YncB( thermonuclease family)
VRYWLLLSALLSSLVAAQEFNAKVIRVTDGDTIVVLHEKRKIKIRLANIDAPEKDQAFGREARQLLFTRVQKKQVRIATQATDKYGRSVAVVSLDGQNINEELVRRGLAWAYFHPEAQYVELQQEAQHARRGLWQQAHPIEPSQWRKRKKHRHGFINLPAGWR